jgi:tetratricopeptide (TPR) repeat protein
MSANPSPAATRLERLTTYLEQDPANPNLLAEVCDAAIACGQHERARHYVQTAKQLGFDSAQWMHRSARIAIATRELDQAVSLLEALREGTGEHPVLDHDLGYVLLLRGDFEDCLQLVQPWLARATSLGPEELQALQVLWLRAVHRLERLEEALSWAREQDAAGMLQPAAKGAASLIAVDAEQLEFARQLANEALGADAVQVEALVARASVGLAAGEGAQHTTEPLQRALQQNPEDGRTWSLLAMISLKEQKLDLAASQLERAVQYTPDDIDAWHALGWTRLLRGDRDGALAAFRRALELDPEFAESHAAMGLMLLLSGDSVQAQQHLEVADRLDPANVTGQYARAMLSGEARDLTALQEVASRLLKQHGWVGVRPHGAVPARTRRQK